MRRLIEEDDAVEVEFTGVTVFCKVYTAAVRMSK